MSIKELTSCVLEEKEDLSAARFNNESPFTNTSIDGIIELLGDNTKAVTRKDPDYLATEFGRNIEPNTYKSFEEITEILKKHFIDLQTDIFHYIRQGTVKSILRNPEYSGPRSFDFIEAEDINKRVMEKAQSLQATLTTDDDPVALVNLDPLLDDIMEGSEPIGYNLKISRKKYLHNKSLRTGEVVARPGAKPIEEQLADIPNSIKRVILMDDNIETMGSLEKAVEILEEAGFEVVGAVVGINLGSKYLLKTKKGMIPVDAAVKYTGDKNPKVIEGGNMVEGARGTTLVYYGRYADREHVIRTHEIDPFAKVADLSEMDEDIRYEVSHCILERNIIFYSKLREEEGLSFKLGNMLPGSRKYLHFESGYDYNTSMITITEWALKQLENSRRDKERAA
ncbi:MAG TPA: phosphoribosyltransferase [Candidatus Saccharimonadales bacterium]|nr:phosphoribosyltransferase [Candidatus Saccharimonadales bacterium]